jgi:predicted SAM-dependent methyltransferase
MIRQLKKINRRVKESFKRIRTFIFFSKMKKIKFNLGSAGINADDSWFATDIELLNITKESDWKKLLFHLKADNLMAEHVWEHLSEADTKKANQNCFKFLKKNGVLRIAVPDGFHPDKDYIDYVKPGGHGAGADDHKILYNYVTLRESLEKVGFKVNLLEYWDEQGNFNCVNWTDEGGHIRRSKRYDDRNKDGVLRYTSLIADAVKQ